MFTPGLGDASSTLLFSSGYRHHPELKNDEKKGRTLQGVSLRLLPFRRHVTKVWKMACDLASVVIVPGRFRVASPAAMTDRAGSYFLRTGRGPGGMGGKAPHRKHDINSHPFVRVLEEKYRDARDCSWVFRLPSCLYC